MKKCILCFAVLILFLMVAGCGKQEEADSPSGAEEQTVAGGVSADESPFVPVANDFHQMILPLPIVFYNFIETDQNWVYLGRSEYNIDEQCSEIRIYRNAIFDAYHPERYITIPEQFSLLAFLVDEGDVFVYGQYADNEGAGLFTLEKYDDAGTLLWSRDYTDKELEGMGSRLRSGSVASDGRVFLYTYGENGGVVSFDGEGVVKGTYVSQLMMIQGMAATGGGKMYVYGTVIGGQAFEEVGGDGEQFASSLTFQKAFSGEGDSIYLYTGKGLWEYIPGEGDPLLLWNWDDEYVQMTGSDVEKIWHVEDIYYVMSTPQDGINSGLAQWQIGQPLTFSAIDFRDRTEYPSKKVVTLARSYVADANSLMEDLVRLYNRQSKEYTVELVSYQTGTPDVNSLNKLEQDLLRGQGPDLIELSNVYALNWAEIGILEDLGEYYEASSVISQGDLLPQIQEACTLNGKNVLVIPSFYIKTWCSKEAVPAEEWTVWKYLELSQERQVFPLSDPYSAFVHSTELSDTLDRFVDYEAKECHFDSLEFAEFLQECAKVPSKEVPRVTWSGDFVDAEYLALDDWYISSMSDYLMLESWYGDDVSYQGMPGWDGAEHVLYAYDVFAMNSASGNKEGAWDFLEFLLSKEIQNTMDWGFPAREDSLQGYLERSYNSDSLNVRQLEEEDFKAVRNMISASVYTSLMSQGDTVWKIVREEVSMFFAGDASLEKTVEKIQNRLSVYLQGM